MPNGVRSKAPKHKAITSPVPPGKMLPVRALRIMYEAQKHPARSANITPTGSRSTSPRIPSGASRRMPPAASAAQRTSSSRRGARDRDAQRTDELQRNGDTQRNAVYRQVEREVHARQREPEEHRYEVVAPGIPRNTRAPEKQ